LFDYFQLIASGTDSDTGVFYVDDFFALTTVTDSLGAGIREFALEGITNKLINIVTSNV